MAVLIEDLNACGTLDGAKALFRASADWLGFIARRPLEGNGQRCEVKRLSMRAEACGQKIGAALVGAVMVAARALYAACGSAEVPPEDRIAYPGVVFMARDP